MPSIEQLGKLLAAEPDDVFLNFALAMEYVGAGRLDDAVRQFARVLELDAAKNRARIEHLAENDLPERYSRRVDRKRLDLKVRD